MRTPHLARDSSTRFVNPWMTQARIDCQPPSDAAALLDSTCRGSIPSRPHSGLRRPPTRPRRLLYWHVGRRLLPRREPPAKASACLLAKRILATVSQELSGGVRRRLQLRRRKLTAHGPDLCRGSSPDRARSVSTLSTQLSWSHFIELLTDQGPRSHRDFYAEMCRIERLGCAHAATEDRQACCFQRTALSTKAEVPSSPPEVGKLRDGQMTPDDISSSATPTCSICSACQRRRTRERDLESAILREIEACCYELRRRASPSSLAKNACSFVKRRIFDRSTCSSSTADLCRLIAVELKLG